MENTSSPKFSETEIRAFVRANGKRAVAAAMVTESREFALAVAAWVRKNHGQKAW